MTTREYQDTPEWRKAAEIFEQRKAAAAAVFAAAAQVYPVDFWLDDQGPEETWPKPLGEADGIPFYSRGRDQGADFARRLGDVVLDPRSYCLPGIGTTGCLFKPTVGFRVRGEAGHMDVVVCFGCLQLMVLEDGPDVPIRGIGGRSGRFNVAGDFDPACDQLLALRAEAFGEG